MRQEKKVILLAGPTASGKSKLAIKLAQYFDGEIINADSMQIYKEISILTSKPNSQDIKAIKHHLYGFNSVKKKFSTGHWLKLVVKKIEEQWENERMPIVVGGTGLYFKALTDGLVKIPDIPNKTRTQIRKLHKKIGQKNFFIQLIKLDPLAKRLVLPSDTQRSMRAYEVKKFTNKSLFEFLKETKSNFNNNVFKKLFINTPRELLHKKIEKRVEKMFNDGVIDEVKKFKIGFCACILAGGIITVSPASYAQEQSNLVAPAPNQVDVIPVVSNNDAYAFESDDVTHPPLRLTPDKSTLIRLPRAAGSIIVGNPNHLNILPDSSLTLVAVPRMPGASFFTVLDKDGEVVMQRHVIVASPSKKYVRIRRTCNGDAAGSGAHGQAGCGWRARWHAGARGGLLLPLRSAHQARRRRRPEGGVGGEGGAHAGRVGGRGGRAGTGDPQASSVCRPVRVLILIERWFKRLDSRIAGPISAGWSR